MHSFHYSRGRILFEVFCALAIAASCVGAWMQTGASAFLPAAVAAALYGLVHVFDMRRRKPTETVVPQRIEFEGKSQGGLPGTKDAKGPLAADDQPLTSDDCIKEADLVEPVAPATGRKRRAKAPGKGGARSAKVPKVTSVREIIPPEDGAVAKLMPPEVAQVAELAPPVEVEVAFPTPEEEAAHPHIEQLFEPEPFARLPRRAFGRKAG